ncbi:sulfite exporter TauE/SafE family protein [Rhizobium alvei]|uniref:Probable membrane transporter protein n=1 Tax=Rhizobium alvei TaxID=1132659 RepID=A0ABT8YGS5_9HYPH|nr:sulfite exporter TauE/SafE family protein [Rhizobium alvei]MDO6962883.1 sulfite exporter TauE/SafE family protein [Rhizobium alvei]
MPEHFLIIALAALIVGLAKGGLATAGTLAVPMLTFWYDPLTAASLLLPVFLISDAVGVWVYRREFSARNIAILAPSALFGVLVASLLSEHVPSWVIVIATGIIGIAYCLTAWIGRHEAAEPRQPNLAFGLFMGVLTGITSFIAHSGAPPFQAYVLPQKLPKMVFAGTTTITFAIVNLSKLPAYYTLGLMDDLNVTTALVLCAIAVGGTFLGRYISRVLPDVIYRRVIMVLLFLISIQLVIQGGYEATL